MTAATAASREAFPANWWARAGWLLLAVYVVYALSTMDFSWARIEKGLGEAAQRYGKLFSPVFAPATAAGPDKYELIVKGLRESLQISVLATVLGILLALPIGLLGARNLMPAWVTWPARAIVAVCRTFHPVIVAIVFVKALGFGALAGVGALTVASIGFIGKLFAEAIEEISLKQVEAVRATGASFPNLLIFAVLPQVFSRFIGFATYQLDSNLRNSTMVGIVGAGGIGGTLFAAFQRFEYDFVGGILLCIISMIFLGEVLANVIRRIFATTAGRQEKDD
jgi:phosphonate transport system permease protein